MNWILNSIYDTCSKIKSYFVETPVTDSPQTFNFTHEQYLEIHATLDRGEQLSQETNALIDEDLKNIMGEELYNEMNKDLELIEAEFQQKLIEILNEEFPTDNIHCPLESSDLYGNLGFDYATIIQIIDFIINLISHIYFW